MSGPFAQLVHKIGTDEELEGLFTNSSGRVAILFSEKDTVSMLYKSVAFSCQSHSSGTTFAQAPKDSSLMQRMGVSSAPALVLSLTNGTSIHYNGSLKDRDAMIDWCRETAPTVAGNESSAESLEEVPDNVKVVRRTQAFMNKLQKNIFATSTSSFVADVIDKTVVSWVVLVHLVRPEVDAAQEKTLSTALAYISNRCEGAVEVSCHLPLPHTCLTQDCSALSVSLVCLLVAGADAMHK